MTRESRFLRDALAAGKLVRVGSDGGGREVVAGVETFRARWSPDGRRIAQ